MFYWKIGSSYTDVQLVAADDILGTNATSKLDSVNATDGFFSHYLNADYLSLFYEASTGKVSVFKTYSNTVSYVFTSNYNISELPGPYSSDGAYRIINAPIQSDYKLSLIVNVNMQAGVSSGTYDISKIKIINNAILPLAYPIPPPPLPTDYSYILGDSANMEQFSVYSADAYGTINGGATTILFDFNQMGVGFDNKFVDIYLKNVKSDFLGGVPIAAGSELVVKNSSGTLIGSYPITFNILQYGLAENPNYGAYIFVTKPTGIDVPALFTAGQTYKFSITP
jgi:hypothetical protein